MRRLRLKDFPAPTGGWKICKTCGQKWTQLATETECVECAPWRPARRRPLSREGALVAAGVPLRHQVAFIAPDPWPVPDGEMASVESWEGDPELLTFLGPSDTGKTVLAVELLWRCNGRRAWVTAGRIPDVSIRGEAGEWDRLTGADALLIDELGRGHNRDGWEYVYAVVAERWNWRRPTILTTNLSLEEIEAAHPPLCRRLQEGWAVPLRRHWRTRVAGGGDRV